MPELPELNPVIHGKLRLALLSLLAGVDEAEFTWLRAKTGSTDGNLGAQLLKLEEAGYVSVEKKFVQRKPQTLYRMTESGARHSPNTYRQSSNCSALPSRSKHPGTQERGHDIHQNANQISGRAIGACSSQPLEPCG